jgi:universal stress protein A
MTQLFHKILCPIDFSEHSLAALDIALKVALQNDARLYLLNVAPVQAGAVGLQPVPMDPYPFHENDRQEDLLKLGRERVPAAVSYETMVVIGDPAEQVLNAARRVGADLIVMGTHGRGMLRHLVLGSVAERVVRESTIPVLTSHATTRAQKAA